MRKVINFLIVSTSLIILLISCNKNGISDGHINATFNNVKWDAQMEFGTHSVIHKDNIALLFYVRENGVRRQSFSIQNIPFFEGRFECKAFRSIDSIVDTMNHVLLSFGYLKADGDVIGTSYILDEDPEYSNIRITEVDYEKNFIKGEVNALFHKDTTSVDVEINPDIIEIKSGEFEAYIEG